LAAMEAMASGVPLIISNNTGHADIIRDGKVCCGVWCCGVSAVSRERQVDEKGR
jgi:glycosyltransferase involved in cell wall biosynthesis